MSSVFSSRSGVNAGNLHTVGRNLAENVSEHVEHVDFFSENTIGACVTCCVAVIIWLVFLPIFHLIGVPYMESWEAQHPLTVTEYMGRAEETFPSPLVAFEVLDADGDHNSTRKEFEVGSARFARPPFPYPAAVTPIFNAFDQNQDGMIQEDEFYRQSASGVPDKWHINMTDLKVRAKQGYGFLDSYYSAMDLNSDGKVDEQEFVDKALDLVPPVQPGDAKKLFREADTDGMGTITPREWVAYGVNRSFLFKTGLEPGILPTGPKVMMATTAGLTASLQVLTADLLTVVGIEDVTNKADSKSRKLADKLNHVALKISFSVLIGTRLRQNIMQTAANGLPDATFKSYFENSISGGSTTAGPSVAPATTGPPAKPGKLSRSELEDYMNVPAIIQGRTMLELSHAAAGVNDVEKQKEKVRPLFQNSLATFCDCDVSVESVQATVMQDELGNAATNKSIVISWTTDSSDGGNFQKHIWDDGWQLVYNIKHDIVKENLPSFVGTNIDSWTRFSCEYYGSEAATLGRGKSIEQYVGHHKALGEVIARNDTGSAPFVKATGVKADTL